MDFDLSWLLIGLPVAFALGWLSSRIDLRQWRRAQREAPKAYFQGLNLLLNEQPDKAIDVFVEAVQRDPDTAELHFALGNLFRRRGEFERAVRVHEHLLSRGDLPRSERERAQHALAQDFVKAGLFDRAEAAYRALEGTPFDTESRLALLALHERARDWRAAGEVAAELERRGAGSFGQRIAHHGCELALQADAQGRVDEGDEALARARRAAPLAPRPLLLAASRLARAARHAEALDAWAELAARDPAAFTLAATDAAASARVAGLAAAWRERFEALHARLPSLEFVRALGTLDAPGAADVRARLVRHLAERPTLGAAADLLALDAPTAPSASAAQAGPREGPEHAALREAVTRAARPLQRYRCAACGFESPQHYWQCPGCLSWDSYPPLRVDEQ